jgi:hypothetical protein
MSGVLHPMGPEPAQTYWVRRAVLVAVVLLLAVIVVFGVANLTKAAVATAPPPAIPPAGTSPSPSTVSSPATTSTPSAAASPAPSTASGGASASAAPPKSAGPSGSTAAKPPATPTTQPSAATKTPATQPTPVITVIGTPDCRPAALRVKVSGDRTLSPGQNTTFTLSLVNGAALTCLTSVTDKNFELKIYSGQDRIWSSRDCARSLAAFDKKLAPRAGVAWKMAWNGERSVKGKDCKSGTDTPTAGVYWATAQLNGAKPVQLRMIIS